MLLSASDLTRGEKLLINRRRLNQTQGQMSLKLDIELHIYRQWENDSEECEVKTPNMKVGSLHKHEQCFVLRRREGWSLAEGSEEIGVSRYWLCQMERGQAPVDTLYNYWAA